MTPSIPPRKNERTGAANWQTILAVDFDKWAAATYAANFPGVDVRCASVADLNAQEAIPCADVYLGGPPCQAHSLAGKRLASKDKRDCGPDFVGAVHFGQPRMFLMENVDGLMSSENGRYAQRLLASMEDAGYVVQIKILDSVSFGVPQFRFRCWWWGIRKDLYAAGMRHAWPKPTHAWPPPGPCMFDAALEAGITVGQSLGITDNFTIRRGAGPGSDQAKRGLDYPVSMPSPCVSGLHGGGGINKGLILQAGVKVRIHGAKRTGGPGHDVAERGITDEPAQTVGDMGHGSRNGEPRLVIQVMGGGRNHPRGADGQFQRDERDITNEPSTTISSSGFALHGGAIPRLHASEPILYRWSDAMLYKHPPASLASPAPTVQAKWFKGGAEGLLHWKQTPEGLWVRRLTPLECLRLQSGPDDFRWPEEIGKTAMYRVVGNGWSSTMGRVFADAFAAVDPESRTIVDLFCGGGLGAVGWHGKSWTYEPELEVV